MKPKRFIVIFSTNGQKTGHSQRLIKKSAQVKTLILFSSFMFSDELVFEKAGEI